MATLIIDYTLQFQDLMTVPLRKASTAAESSLAKVTKAAKQATTQLQALTKAAKQATDSIGSAAGKAATKLGALEDKFSKVAKATQKVSAQAQSMGQKMTEANGKISKSITEANKRVMALDDNLDRLTHTRKVSVDLDAVKQAQQALKGVNAGSGAGAAAEGGEAKKLDVEKLSFGLNATDLFGTALSAVRETAKQQRLDGAIGYLAGSATEGATAIQFLEQTSSRLGIRLGDAKEGFYTLQKALNDTCLEGQNTRDIFQQVAAATTVMSPAGSDAKAVFEQLGAIMEHGKLKADDLGGEIGKQIPGAFKIAADAMGVTQEQFRQMVETGQVASEDFLPRFATQLGQVAGPGLAAAQASAQANLNRFDDAWLMTKIVLTEAVMPAVIEVLGWLRWLMEGVNQFRPVIQAWSNELGLVAVVIGSYLAYLQAYTAYVKIATVLTEGWAAVQTLFNIVMKDNPIGFVIGLITVLAAAVTYCWSKFESFRGFLFAFAAYAKTLFLGLGKVIWGALSGNLGLMKEGAGELLDMPNKIRQGYAQGVASFQADHPKNGGLNAAKTPDQQLGAAGAKPAAAPKASIGLPDAKGRGSAAAAASGHTNITINVQQLGQTTIHAATVQEGAQKMKAYVQAALLSVLNDANAMTTAS